MSVIVRKYGGTSVDGSARLLDIARRVAALREEGHDVVVVVSAPGKMTDSLLEQAEALCDNPTQRELDMLMTAGERVSMSLLAIALNSIGCPAVSFTGSQVGIITDTSHTDARILEVKPSRVVKELKSGNVVVVGGFQGVSTAKDVTTLGRGGSDTTAVALAAALGAERCEILSDVDGVYTADPNVVSDARKIDEISYEDMCELARFGATVLKEDAVRFAELHSIALRVGESAGESAGTIVLENPRRACPPVVGLSHLKGVEVVHRDSWPDSAAVEASGPSTASVHLVSAGSGSILVVVDRAAAETRRGPWLDGASEVVRGDLICIAGPEAGGANVALTAASVAEGLGVDILAMASEGRSTLLAVGPERSGEVLAALHETLISAES
jgi:aspartokinase